MNNKTGLPPIPGEIFPHLTNEFEQVIDGAMVSPDIAFVQVQCFTVEAARAIDDNYDDAFTSWSLRRANPIGDCVGAAYIKEMPDEFGDFDHFTISEILENEKACNLIRQVLDPITIQEIMSLPEILDSAFLKKVGIVDDRTIAQDTIIHIDVQDDIGP